MSATVLAGVAGVFFPGSYIMASKLRMKLGTTGCGALLAGVLLLAGCSNYDATTRGEVLTSDSNVGAAHQALTGGSGFTARLGQEYYTIASQRVGDKDWIDADYFARKSIAASQGQVVLPEANTKWGIPGASAATAAPEPDTRGHMAAARQDLLAVLDAGGRERYPALAARTQARYDCWVERTEGTGAADFNGQCHKDFDSHLSDLKVLVYRPAPANAYFQTGSAELTAEAKRDLNSAAAMAKDGTARFQVAGHADRVGSDSANMILSQKRAEAVRNALEADGIDASRIDVTWTGERSVPVPTRDGQAEVKNRVVTAATVLPVQAAELH